MSSAGGLLLCFKMDNIIIIIYMSSTAIFNLCIATYNTCKKGETERLMKDFVGLI